MEQPSINQVPAWLRNVIPQAIKRFKEHEEEQEFEVNSRWDNSDLWMVKSEMEEEDIRHLMKNVPSNLIPFKDKLPSATRRLTIASFTSQPSELLLMPDIIFQYKRSRYILNPSIRESLHFSFDYGGEAFPVVAVRVTGVEGSPQDDVIRREIEEGAEIVTKILFNKIKQAWGSAEPKKIFDEIKDFEANKLFVRLN